MASSIDSRAALSARQAQSESAALQREIRALRDKISGLGRGIHAPVIRAPRQVIKGSSSSINPLLRAATAAIARYAIGDYLAGTGSDGDSDGGGQNQQGGSAGGRLYRSASQIAGRALGDLALGQRIR